MSAPSPTRDVFHRHRAKAHPGEDIGERGEDQARDRLARHLQPLAAAQRQRGEDCSGERAGKPACKQRRPLQQQQLHQGPVQRPAEGGDDEAEEADRAVAAGGIHRRSIAGAKGALHRRVHAGEPQRNSRDPATERCAAAAALIFSYRSEHGAGHDRLVSLGRRRAAGSDGRRRARSAACARMPTPRPSGSGAKDLRSGRRSKTPGPRLRQGPRSAAPAATARLNRRLASPRRAAEMRRNFIARHWRGEYPLWVVLLGGRLCQQHCRALAIVCAQPVHGDAGRPTSRSGYGRSSSRCGRSLVVAWRSGRRSASGDRRRGGGSSGARQESARSGR